MKHYPSIEQFRNAVHTVGQRAAYIGKAQDGTAIFDYSRPKPTLVFTGTVKLHGSNGGIRYEPATNLFSAQSRENVLTARDHNMGFYHWVESDVGIRARELLLLAAKELLGDKPFEAITFFGEWCGPGVNEKTAIGQLHNAFYVFGAAITYLDGSENCLDTEDLKAAYYRNAPEVTKDIRFLTEFQKWTLAIDFENPESALEALEKLTLEVENVCPVAKALGLEGLGEGIVWVCDHPVFGQICFKTKGLKHAGTKKAGNRLSIAPEVLANRDAFTEAVLTQARLEQGFDLLRAEHGVVTSGHVGPFLKWIGMDVLKEESDTLEASGLDRKDVMSTVNRRAKAWFTQALTE